MKKILVIGCPGSGKSTLSERLAKALDLELIHLDRINWINDHHTLSRAEFDDQLEKVLSKDRWIIDGNYNRTLSRRLIAADTVIWLDLPRTLCIYRILKRFVKAKMLHKGTFGNPNKIEKDFLNFVWNFNKTNRPLILNALSNCSDKRILILKANKEIKQIKKILT
ncbi:AAA family ATPase [Marinilactibacillus sp. Marseille-P9653]|uniref:AAA family ATPase n=1 Tax=Marinilactibacillus sp. Marseille-P9653 TaxID=2866583 RepID=UPI001CE3D42C|nr:AAA family ATPase [Marinilactibacillus sp. Marseille-P9653]